ncbi:Dimer-Tnp-hAT domain-containing protein [Mycena sanguinolenta]|uniref:Dimer-Tnp-hAT domain-containing protein n=1 Tax=Mycena sanguinolenta TaxID=230812 RepID=A0A8H6XI54_9AGAR|nr:Dimer-Tnp-hAT domain-containing protein [Mycena sanguinolenta]
MRKHAVQCFGQNVVDAAMNGEGATNPDGSIFAAFARAGQRPVNVAYRAHTNPEARANIVQWVTESTRPAHLVNDRGFRTLMTAGRPTLQLPSGRTVSRDIRASFIKCKTTIDNLLQNYPGQLNFATDAWTSPNHRAFVAWTVHLHYEGSPLAFLLDIIEVPESHTGETLTRAFDRMLASHGLSDKILSWAGDNASSNDTQTITMSNIQTNSFNKRNRVRCFTHTLNLVAKSILKPFSAPKKKKKTGEDDAGDNDTDSIPDLVSVSDSEPFDGAFDTDGDDEEMDSAEEEDESSDVEDDIDVDERAALEGEEQKAFDAETRIVKKTLDKVCAPP